MAIAYSHLGYIISALIMGLGLFGMMYSNNYVKKIIGLSIFQSAVIFFYVLIGKVAGGTAPIYKEGATLYSNSLPHVLMLTAIVVGIATVAVALSLIIKIKESYNSIDENTVLNKVENKEENNA